LLVNSPEGTVTQFVDTVELAKPFQGLGLAAIDQPASSDKGIRDLGHFGLNPF
jgi:hypothetical protein